MIGESSQVRAWVGDVYSVSVLSVTSWTSTVSGERIRSQASRYCANHDRLERGETKKAFAICDHGNGENIPGVFRKNISDEEVNLSGTVTTVSATGGSNVVMRAPAGNEPCRLDLDAPEDLAAAKNNVITVAVPPRLGNREAEGCGFAHEG